jgi:putative component of toxin-antitoxin plasmid stabilization module
VARSLGREGSREGFHCIISKDGECIVIILGGGTKKRQQQDINTAKAYWRDYKTRKRKSK